MAVKTMYAILANEPFNLLPEEIAKLTDWQIEEIYGHPRSRKTGALETETADQEPVRLTYEQKRAMHYEMGLALNIPLKDLQDAWRKKHGRD